ncbi:4101_t:CDS:1, partial [Scutellospora calospora]
AASIQDMLGIRLMFTLLSVLATLGCRYLVLVFIKEKRKGNLNEINKHIQENQEQDDKNKKRKYQIRYSMIP